MKYALRPIVDLLHLLGRLFLPFGSDLSFSEDISPFGVGSEDEIKAENHKDGHGDQLEDDTSNHDIRRGLRGRSFPSRRTGLSTSYRLKNQRNHIGGEEHDKVVAGSKDGVLRTEFSDGDSENDIVVRGEEDGSHDEGADLHEEWSEITDIVVGPKTS